jgi:hypothetical protein
MKTCTPYLLYQIARFGSLTMREIAQLTEERFGRTNVYDGLKAMLHSKLIVRLAYSNASSTVYQATDSGRSASLGQALDHTRSGRVADVTHSIRAAQTLIALSRYEYVTGFGTEFEIPLEQWREFSRSKVPDGVIQVTRDNLSYELAVEVEVTPKTWTRSEDFVTKYQEAFDQKARCSGVILVCDEQDIFDRYQTLLQKKGESIAKRFLVIRGPELPALNRRLYGEVRKKPGFCADKRRASSGGENQYLPMKFALQKNSATQQAPDKDPLSGKLKIEEKIQQISQ